MTTASVEYSDDLAAAICERLADGEPLTKILASEGMPKRSTFYVDWLHRPGFAFMYQVARETWADAEFDRLEELVNETPALDDRKRVDNGWVQNQRLKIESLKYRLRVLHPRRFAERMELTGAEGKPLVPPSEEMTPERRFEALRRFAFLLQQAGELNRPPPPAPLLLPHELSLRG